MKKKSFFGKINKPFSKRQENISYVISVLGIFLFVYFLSEYKKDQYLKKDENIFIVGSVLGEIKAIKRLCLENAPIVYLTAYKNVLKDSFKKAQKNIEYHPDYEMKQIIEGFAQSYFVSLEKSFFTFQMNTQHQQQETTIKEFCDEMNKIPLETIQQKKEYLEKGLMR